MLNIYGQIINEVEQCRDVLASEIEGVQIRAFCKE